MAGVKRSVDMDSLVETELDKLCREVKCDVCVVPLAGREVATKHYGGKIHAKKVERWKESWMNQKKLKMENESLMLPYSYREYSDDTSTRQVEVEDTQGNEMVNKKDNDNSVDTKKNFARNQMKEEMALAMTMPLDPKLIDSMDPATMKKMLSGKPMSRWDTPLEISGGSDDAADNTLDDPDDLSIPIDSSKLLKKCVNPQSGTGNQSVL